MQELDNKFFEEYKRLDKLCSEILSCQNGVSEYILQMERTSSGQYKISSWNDDYKKLKHLRWVRNQIAHNTSGYMISEETDLLEVIDFYDRIMSQNDPFAQLWRAETEKLSRSQTYSIGQYYSAYSKPEKNTEFSSGQTNKNKTQYGGNTAKTMGLILLMMAGIFVIYLFMHVVR